jgi:hypothetical protein
LITSALIRKQRAAHRMELWRRINSLARMAMDYSADAANSAYHISSVERDDDGNTAQETFNLADLQAQEEMMRAQVDLLARDIRALCAIAKHGV